MTPVSCGTIAVDHCDYCGGTFFDQNEINRITLEHAITLAEQKEADSLTGNSKNCPKDGAIMKSVQMESVPRHVVLLQCDTCSGVFVFADDLVEFKKAQNAKLHYYSAWRIPMPSVSAIIVFSFVVAISAGLAYRFNPFFGPPSAPIRATDELCSIELINTPTTTTIYCKSSQPYASEALFYNSATGEKITRVINKTPILVHLLTVDKTDIPQSPDICVQLSLTNDQGTRETPCVPFVK